MVGCGVCSNEQIQSDRVLVSDKQENTDAVIENFTSSSYDKSKLLWELTAQKAYINHKSKVIQLENILIIYYGDKQEKTSVYGNLGEFNSEKNKMQISNKVKIEASNGKKIYTDEIYWEKKDNKFHCKKNVKLIFKNGHEVYASHLITDPTLENITLNEVQGVIRER